MLLAGQICLHFFDAIQLDPAIHKDLHCLTVALQGSAIELILGLTPYYSYFGEAPMTLLH